MKKILLMVAVIAMTATTASAQLGFVGGSLGFNNYKFGDEKATTFAINPHVAFSVADNWAIGVGLNYDYSKAEAGSAEAKTSLFGFSISGYYSYQIANKFYYTPSLTFDMGFGKDEAEDKYTAWGVNLSFFGFEFRPADKWGFTTNFGSLGYNSFKYKDADDAEGLFSLNVLNNASLGVRFYF